jgi:predicted anti-sigma-YlaC factor YlaD
MNCLEVLEQLSTYLDKEASEQLCKAIDAHLRACPNCKFEYDSLQKTILLTHPESSLPALPPQAKEQLQQALSALYKQPPDSR